VQQLPEGEQGAGGHRDRDVDVLDVEGAGLNRGGDVPSGARCEPAVGAEQPQDVVEEDPAELRLAAVQPSGEPEAAGEHLRGVLDVGGQVVEKLTVAVHHRLDRSVEQLLLGLEVVIEGPHPHVSGLGDLQDRHVRPALGDEGLRRADQSRPRPGLAAVQAVGLLRWCVAHDRSLGVYVSGGVPSS
jgi:hypothetical protein